jgi:hypothetical protein
MDSQEQKRKKLFQWIKKAVITFFIGMVIFSFVISLVYSPWDNGGKQSFTTVAELNKQIFNDQPGSMFSYLWLNLKESISKNNSAQADQTAVAKYAASLAVNYSILRDFAKKQGIEPSAEGTRNIIESIIHAPLVQSPSKGLLEYSHLLYASEALSEYGGDIGNALSLSPTATELYSYYDLANLSATAEILYIQTSNFIMNQIKDSEVNDFYLANISNYAKEALVDDMAVKGQSLVYEINSYVLTNGIEKALEAYKGKISYTQNLKLSNVSGLAKRFAAALKAKEGSFLPKPQFEKGEYHILHLKNLPKLSQISQKDRNQVFSDYVFKNFAQLKLKFDSTIKEAVQKAENALKANQDFRLASQVSGMAYVKTGKISPVDRLLKDEKGNEINLPFFENDAWGDFIFSAQNNEISKALETTNVIVIIKALSKTINTNISYQNIKEETVMDYLKFKNEAYRKDWFDQVKSAYHYKIYDDNISRLVESMQKE